ncbi:MAG TPA: hypothetical protein DDX19_17170 [Rhodopirellula baltica]|nr:hypothetical protein [Rhodopirellula baltica]
MASSPKSIHLRGPRLKQGICWRWWSEEITGRRFAFAFAKLNSPSRGEAVGGSVGPRPPGRAVRANEPPISRFQPSPEFSLNARIPTLPSCAQEGEFKIANIDIKATFTTPDGATKFKGFDRLLENSRVRVP